MKTIERLLSLALILILALTALPALAEADESRTLYPIPFGEELPGWSSWQPVLELDGIREYTLTGALDAVKADAADVSLYCNTLLAGMGLELVSCELVAGEMLSEGKVLVAEAFGRAVGDRITLKSDAGSLEAEVCGIYAPDPEVYENPETLTNTVLIAEEDFLRLLGPDQPDSVFIDAIVLTDEARPEDFIAAANALLADADIRVLSAEERDALYGDVPESAEIGGLLVSAFSGTDLYGEPLPDEVLAPGGVTMVNVWATFCNPCIAEMPGLKALSDEYAAAGAPFRIVGVCMDVTDGRGVLDEGLVDTGKLIVDQTGADYLHIIPDAQMYAELMAQISAYPTTFFLDDAGEVLAVYVGSRSEDDWRGIITGLLAQY